MILQQHFWTRESSLMLPWAVVVVVGCDRADSPPCSCSGHEWPLQSKVQVQPARLNVSMETQFVPAEGNVNCDQAKDSMCCTRDTALNMLNAGDRNIRSTFSASMNFNSKIALPSELAFSKVLGLWVQKTYH